MMHVDKLILLFSRLGHKIKRCNIFGNTGLSADEHTFALIVDNKIYFRATDTELPLYKAKGYCFFSYQRSGPKRSLDYLLAENQPNVRTIKTRYYEVNVAHLNELLSLAQSVIAKTILERKQSQSRMPRLSKLANLNYASERWLKKVNIHHYEDLKRVGAVKAFVLIRKAVNTEVKIDFVLHLQGAIDQVHYSTLSPSLRESLRQKVGKASDRTLCRAG